MGRTGATFGQRGVGLGNLMITQDTHRARQRVEEQMRANNCEKWCGNWCEKCCEKWCEKRCEKPCEKRGEKKRQNLRDCWSREKKEREKKGALFFLRPIFGTFFFSPILNSWGYLGASLGPSLGHSEPTVGPSGQILEQSWGILGCDLHSAKFPWKPLPTKRPAAAQCPKPIPALSPSL